MMSAGCRFQRTRRSTNSSISQVDVTHEPYIVFWSWMMSGDGLNSTAPPSPTKTIFPHLRVARIAVARAAALAEHSIARSTPQPPVRSLT